MTPDTLPPPVSVHEGDDLPEEGLQRRLHGLPPDTNDFDAKADGFPDPEGFSFDEW